MQVESLSPEEALLNEGATSFLVRGTYYDFSPAVSAGGIPVGGPRVCPVQTLQFARGWYLGFRDGNHVFQGKPEDDPRKIDSRFRECYFHVAFIGGVTCTESESQSP